MKLLIYQWNSWLQYDILTLCKERGIGYETFSWKFADKNEDEKFIKWFTKTVECRCYDAVLSINYWPLLSRVCQEQGIKYIAWCYDNPLNVVRMEETLHNSVNYVFLFDRIQYAGYKKEGYKTVYHLPLGVNAARMKQLTISGADYEKYQAQISFVGSLYESELPRILAPVSEYTKGFLHALMDMQSRVYGYYLIDDCLTEEFIEDMNRQYLEAAPGTQFRICKEALSFAMASEITRKDRILLLSLCGQRYDTRLYSYQDSEVIRNVKKRPPVNYITEMPKVFACTKINLNPSLRIIQTGIPLRAFDIMGAGGFLLSNYQEELLEIFSNEEEVAVYESLEDAVCKADFYLRHEDLRKRIADNARIKTLNEHSLQRRFETILITTGLK